MSYIEHPLYGKIEILQVTDKEFDAIMVSKTSMVEEYLNDPNCPEGMIVLYHGFHIRPGRPERKTLWQRFKKWMRL